MLGFNPALPRELLTTFLDTRPEIRNWYSLFAGQIFIVSDRSTRQLSELIRGAFPNQLFLVAHIDGIDCDGWLPEDVWEFIRRADQPPSLAQRPAGNVSEPRR